jgi:AraC-like DNA-binding protein/quercetin dioxygenase-like cupin family protein
LYDAALVSVAAQSANSLPSAVKSGLVDMRTGGGASAGSFPYEEELSVTTWHSHDLHQIEYAFQGAVEVESESGHYLLPPQQAAWIPAGLEHRTTIRTTVRTISVFFHPDLVAAPGERVRILAVPPVLREMMIYSRRWPIGRTGSDSEPLADAFFAVLGQMVSESLDREIPLSLPSSTDPEVAAAMAWTRDHLAEATVAAVARSVGLSERSLRRRFDAVVGMSWRAYLLQARLLRAMALLAEPGPSVLEIATSVGFESLSAFDRTFRLRTGETPSGYRRRRVGA